MFVVPFCQVVIEICFSGFYSSVKYSQLRGLSEVQHRILLFKFSELHSNSIVINNNSTAKPYHNICPVGRKEDKL